MILLPETLKYSAYSHSKITLFEECPKKWFDIYVAKTRKREHKAAFEKGGFVHYALQYYPNPTPKKYTFTLATQEMQDEWFETIKEILSRPRIRSLIKGRVKAEFTWILDYKNGEVFLGNNKWKSLIYGVIDHLCTVDHNGKERLKLVDWKTGKSKGDEDQLKLYAYWMFLANPNLKEVLGGFEYVDQNDYEEFCYTRDIVPVFQEELLTRINTIETCTEFKPTPCKGCTYCEQYTVCPAHKITIPTGRKTNG